MKKLASLLAIVALSTLVNCNRQASADDDKPYYYYKVIAPNDSHTTLIQREYIDGIEYHIYRTTANYGGPFVVNHTKELLEVELLKRQLANTK